MYRKNSVKRALWATLALLISTLLGSCGFSSPPPDVCDLIENVPNSELISPSRNVVFEDPGTIIAYHGSSCAESNKSGTEDILRVEESLDIPPYAADATVFLNGSHLKYLSSDHHVRGLATAIGKIRLEDKTLKWQAAGVLSDDNFDDGYNWCYNYTAVAWNPSNINLTVDHDDGCESGDPRESNFFTAKNEVFIGQNEETTTALSSFPTFLHNPSFAPSKTVAILPRGFGVGWDNDGFLNPGSDSIDHHLFQTGYNLDHSEIFVENGRRYKKGLGEDITPVPTPLPPPPTSSQVDSGFVSWETSAIFKDNDSRRDYSFGELVSGLGGNDVGVIQPPFSILPKEDDDFRCVSGPGPGVRTEEFEIDNIPYEYAIPMLTGWELAYDCDDEHVTEMGTRIDDWRYDKSTGKLHYTLSSSLRDRNRRPDFSSRHKVTVLGLKPVAGGGTPNERVPDLVPFSPLGTDPGAFCRTEQDGKVLRVSVKNQGNKNAAASRATVLFSNGPVTADTPPIPTGGSLDLLFQSPPDCFSLGCSFKITVDSNNQVDESENEGNNSANGECIVIR